MKMLNGWILEVYLAGRDMTLRVIDTTGHAHQLRDAFIPVFFVGGDAKELRDLARFILDQTWDVRLSRAEHMDDSLAHRIVVLQIEVMNPHHFSEIFKRVIRARPQLDYYNGHLPVLQQYLISRGTYPFAFCHFVVDAEDRILGIEVGASNHNDSPPSGMARPSKQKKNLMRTER